LTKLYYDPLGRENSKMGIDERKRLFRGAARLAA